MQKITETLAYGYSSESLTQRKLSNEYQHDRVSMVFRDLCVLVLWTKVASALEGLRPSARCSMQLLENGRGRVAHERGTVLYRSDVIRGGFLTTTHVHGKEESTCGCNFHIRQLRKTIICFMTLMMSCILCANPMMWPE